jgi:hypothetical protein
MQPPIRQKQHHQDDDGSDPANARVRTRHQARSLDKLRMIEAVRSAWPLKAIRSAQTIEALRSAQIGETLQAGKIPPMHP